MPKSSLPIDLSLLLSTTALAATPLGLPPVPRPADNPQSPEKIQLGDMLFHDKRLSSTGEVSWSKYHDASKAFTDNLPVSRGINDLTETRSAPTVVNTAYLKTQLRGGRQPDL